MLMMDLPLENSQASSMVQPLRHQAGSNANFLSRSN